MDMFNLVSLDCIKMYSAAKNRIASTITIEWNNELWLNEYGSGHVVTSPSSTSAHPSLPSKNCEKPEKEKKMKKGKI